jgi:tetratricopeptide (TPR) repeat protein
MVDKVSAGPLKASPHASAVACSRAQKFPSQPPIAPYHQGMDRWLICAMTLGLALVVSGAQRHGFETKLAELQRRHSADPTNKLVLFELGDLCHDEGANDNPEAVKLAEKYFRELIRLEPTNALPLALLGSTFTMKGRDAFWPGTKLSLVKEGLKMMDAAVKRAPDDFHVRMTRAMNNVHMPGFLDREETARDDLAWLWERTQASPGTYPERTRQRIALFYGVALRKLNDTAKAAVVWREGIAIDPTSPLAAEIEQHLAKGRKA